MKARVLFVLLVLGAAEAMARVVAPVPPVPVPVTVEGAARAFLWQGHVHVEDRYGFRRTTPVQPAPVVAVGDSLTYGLGVAVDDAWPALVGAENLGRSGYQSGQIAQLVRDLYGASDDIVRDVRQYPRFRGPLFPAVVVYAASLNDAVQDGALPREMQFSYDLPSSRVGIVRWAAGRVPLAHHELVRWSDYTRFEAHVRIMAEATRAHEARLVVAVFDTFGWADLSSPMAAAARRAGAEVVTVEFPPGDWTVGRWESHPNAAAHARFARAIFGVLS